MDRADRIIAFIETLKAPDGRDVGQPIVLRPWQKDILHQVYGPVGPDGRRICRQAILSLARKNGKGLSLDTPIPTPSGWTTMGEVKPGDVLYDEQGNECHVTFVSEIHHIDCYKFVFSNGEEIVCDGDHRWAFQQADGSMPVMVARDLWRGFAFGGALPSGFLPNRDVTLSCIWQCLSVPTKCIQVDSPNSLFLCGKTMLPTHNTALVAGLCLAHLCGPEAIRNGQLYSVAFDREQAGIIFKYMAAMVYADEELSARLNVVESRKRILDPISGSEYQALSAETRGKHGKSSSFIVFDELAQFGADRELYDVMMTSRGAHAEPMVWVISTQAASDTAVLSELIDYGEKVNRGKIDDPKTRCFCFTVPMTDDPWDEANWKKSNPALGDFRSLDEMRETAERAKRIPSAEAAFRNLYLNQRVDGAAHFITPAVWKHNGGEPDLSLFEDLSVYAGLDLSAKNDLTALVLTCRDGTGTWHVLPYFWTPKEGLVDRAERDRTPYDVWVKQGYLYTTPGRTVDYGFVAQEIKKLMVRMHIAGLKFDRWRIDDMARELRDVGVEAYVDGKEEAYPDGLRMIQHGQGFRDMNPAVEALEDALANGKIRHGMHPVLTMCASNVRVQQDPSGNRKFDKIKSTGRIDGIVALAMALNGAVGGEPERTEFFAEAW